MSRRIVNEPHRTSEPQQRDLGRATRTRQEYWREVLARPSGRFVLGELIEMLTRGAVSAGNSDIHKNAARVDFARDIETLIGQIDPGALIMIHADLVRARFGKQHEDKKETDEEET
jgi:hypothetical protein